MSVDESTLPISLDDLQKQIDLAEEEERFAAEPEPKPEPEEPEPEPQGLPPPPPGRFASGGRQG